jgi:hypothetical protein
VYAAYCEAVRDVDLGIGLTAGGADSLPGARLARTVAIVTPGSALPVLASFPESIGNEQR